MINLSSENNGTTSFIDLLLSSLRNKLRLHHKRLALRQMPFPQNLEEPVLRHIDHRHLILAGLGLDVLGDERPEPVEVDDGAVELVAELVEVPHTNFTEVTGMVLVEEDPVVVHSSGVTTTSGMLSVLSDTTVSGADVTTLLPVLLESRRHFRRSVTPLEVFSCG